MKQRRRLAIEVLVGILPEYRGLRPGDRRFKTVSRMWAIPRDKMMFVIVISGQPDDLNAVSHDIELILSTVHLKNE